MNCPHWLLALTIPFSRSDRARTSPEALVPGGSKDCSGQIAPLASFLRLPEGPGRPLGGKETLPDRHGTVNAPDGTTTTGLRAAASSQVNRSGGSVGPRGWDPIPRSGAGDLVAANRLGGVAGPRIGAGKPMAFMQRKARCTDWWHAGNHPALRMPPGARSPTGFPLPPSPGGSGSVRRLLTSPTYRRSANFCVMSLTVRCCIGMTRP
jgi:hypothetical protein